MLSRTGSDATETSWLSQSTLIIQLSSPLSVFRMM